MTGDVELVRQYIASKLQCFIGAHVDEVTISEMVAHLNEQELFLDVRSIRFDKQSQTFSLDVGCNRGTQRVNLDIALWELYSARPDTEATFDALMDQTISGVDAIVNAAYSVAGMDRVRVRQVEVAHLRFQEAMAALRRLRSDDPDEY